MKHFDITQWTDYVRGLSRPGEREAMEQHLSAGCSACASLAGVLRRVQDTALYEPAVPQNVVRAAKAVFPPHPPNTPSLDWAFLPRVAARLMYDSRNDVTMEG